jgi:DNA primase
MLEEDEGRRKYLLEAAKIVAELESAIEREVYMKELSREFDVSMDTLKQDVNTVRLTMQNLQAPRDNNGFSWNNGRNEKRPSSFGPPVLLPAYQQAERKLLSVMMRDAATARTVHDQLGDAFNVEDHAALAAYLYAFYAQGHDPDVKRFISTLQDDRLERTAASILLMDGDFPFNEQLLDDFIREIRKVPRLRELEQKKEQLVRAERSGDIAQAVQIASEIIALERQLKGRQDDRF